MRNTFLQRKHFNLEGTILKHLINYLPINKFIATSVTTQYNPSLPTLHKRKLRFKLWTIPPPSHVYYYLHTLNFNPNVAKIIMLTKKIQYMSACERRDKHRRSIDSSGGGSCGGHTSRTVCGSCFSSSQSSPSPYPRTIHTLHTTKIHKNYT